MSSPALSLRLGRSVVPPLQSVASTSGAVAASRRFAPFPAEADAAARGVGHSNTGAIKSLSFRDSPAHA